MIAISILKIFILIMFPQMFHDIFHFLRLIHFADHQDIARIHNDHIIQTDRHHQALAIGAVSAVCRVWQFSAFSLCLYPIGRRFGGVSEPAVF